MPIDLRSFWGSNHYSHPPLTGEMVVEAERVLGVKLPSGLIALLKIQNGGYTTGLVHPMKQRTTWAEDHVPLEDRRASSYLSPVSCSNLLKISFAHSRGDDGVALGVEGDGGDVRPVARGA